MEVRFAFFFILELNKDFDGTFFVWTRYKFAQCVTQFSHLENIVNRPRAPRR